MLLADTPRPGGALPGKRDDAGKLAPDEFYLSRLLGTTAGQLTSEPQRRMVAEAGLPLTEGCTLDR